MSGEGATLRFGLPEHAIAAMLAVFSKYPEIETVVIYGSRAKGNFRPGSDIDLTLEESGMPLSRCLQLESDLEDLLLPYKIDLSLRREIEDPALIDHIRRIGTPLYRRPEQEKLPPGNQG